MNPIIKQGLIQLIYSTFIHNSEVIAFGLGIVISLLLLIRKPKRNYVFFLIGFTCLLINFEYSKHIVDPLYQQTVGVVVTAEGYQRTRRLIDLMINNFIPLILYISGWLSIFLAMILGNRKKK